MLPPGNLLPNLSDNGATASSRTNESFQEGTDTSGKEPIVNKVDPKAPINEGEGHYTFQEKEDKETPLGTRDPLNRYGATGELEHNPHFSTQDPNLSNGIIKTSLGNEEDIKTSELVKNIANARVNGASWGEINGAIADKRAEAQAKGISDKEFNDALGIPNPPEGQQYFTFSDMAPHPQKAFIDSTGASWDALKSDWTRMMAPLNTPIPDSVLGQVKQQFDSLIGAGRIPMDAFNGAMSAVIAPTYGEFIAKPLSKAETNLEAAVKSHLENVITDPDTLKAWQSSMEGNLNTALLALGPKGDELALAARTKVSPIISPKDTLDAAVSIIGDEMHVNAAASDKIGMVADNLHSNWVKTGEPPIEAAKRAQTDPDFNAALKTLPVKEPELQVLPATKEIVARPDPVEPQQKINPKFADERPVTPTIHEPPSPELGAKVAGAAADESLKGVKDFADLFVKDPIAGSKVGANYLKEVFTPTTVSPAAEVSAAIGRKVAGETTRATAITQASVNDMWQRFGDVTKEKQIELIDYMQHRSEGATIDPALQEPADTMRAILKERADKLSQLPQFAKMEFQRDYFRQQWKPNELAQQKWEYNLTRQGSTSFAKEKVIPSHKEGLEYGFEPAFDHPLENVMNTARNMDRVIGHTEHIQRLIDRDLAIRATEGVPKGWIRLDGGLAGDHGEGAVYANPDAARIYNNSISKGFQGTQGEIWKALNGTSNFLRQLKLGLSPYHAGTTVISSQLREAGLGIGELLNAGQRIKEGDVIGAGKNLAGGTARIFSAPLAPIKHYMEGMKGLKEYLAPSSTDPQTKQLIDLLTKANSVTHKMPDYMSEGSYMDMYDKWQKGDYDNIPQNVANYISELSLKNFAIKLPVTIAQGFSSFVATTMRPIFNNMVPRIKTGASMEALRQWIEDHPNATYGQQVQAARTIGDSMDNLMGEMMRNNLFWDKQLEQSTNLGFLSYGWVLGELRGVSGGLKDIATLKNSTNAQNVIGFVMTMAVYNSVYQYLKTGKQPETLTDLMAPQTGGQQKAGGSEVPERAVLPGHTSQLLHWKQDFLHEVFGNEVNPLISGLGVIITGKNWASFDTYNHNGDFAEKGEEFSKAMWQQIQPLMLQNLELGAKKGSNLSPTERFIGVRQAPPFVSNPEGYEEQQKYFNEKDWKAAQKFDQKQKASYENPD